MNRAGGEGNFSPAPPSTSLSVGNRPQKSVPNGKKRRGLGGGSPPPAFGCAIPRPGLRRGHDRPPPHPPRPPVRFRQDRAARIRPLPRRARRRDPVHRRHGEGAAGCRRAGEGRVGPHRLSGNPGRARQDAGAAGPWRHPRPAGPRGPSRADGSARHRADRPRRGESLPLRVDGREGRILRRLHREHRHRRPRHDPQRGEEPCRRRGADRARAFRSGAGRDRGAGRHHAGHAPAPRCGRLCAHRGL